jgi:RNA polymerase sigma-70 factor (ECF subfamily)
VPEGEPTQPGAPREACPDVVDLFSRHVEGEISSDLCSRMQQHLDACPRCRARCDSLRETLVLCRSTAARGVPGEVQDSVRAALRRFLASTK